MHGFYLDDEDKTISFDVIVDFKADNREKTYRDVYDEVQKEFNDYKLNITLDVDTSD